MSTLLEPLVRIDTGERLSPNKWNPCDMALVRQSPLTSKQIAWELHSLRICTCKVIKRSKVESGVPTKSKTRDVPVF